MSAPEAIEEPIHPSEVIRTVAGAVHIAVEMLICGADYSDVLEPKIAGQLDVVISLLRNLEQDLRRDVIRRAGAHATMDSH